MDIEEVLRDDSFKKFEEIYNDAIIGISQGDEVIYDYDLMVDCLMQRENMDEEEACDYINYQMSFGEYPKPIIKFNVIKEINDEKIRN